MHQLKIEKFYGYYTTGAAHLSKNKNNFSNANLLVFQREILKNTKKLKIDKKNLKNKNIMNVGSGREALGFLQFNPSKIYLYDISKKNIKTFKKNLTGKKYKNIFKVKRLDLCKNKLPNNKFDLIYLHGIIQHTDNPGRALKNIFSSLKSNGVIWLYFYRAGSFVNFLASIQRVLIKKINQNNFINFLRKNYDYKFVDRIIDDCFVPNRYLFYPSQYINFIKKHNLEIYGNSLLLPNVRKKTCFNKFHSSTILFLRKKSKNKINYFNIKDKLNSENSIDMLQSPTYKEKYIREIIKNINLMNKKNTQNIYKTLIAIEKIKNKLSKLYVKKKKISNMRIKSEIQKINKYIS